MNNQQSSTAGSLGDLPPTIKQPPALSILFFAEMWERFGFYIIQALLVLYLTQALGWTDDDGYALTGAFTAFVYISPIFGGYIADKILGFKTSIIVGGILFVLGYGMLAIAGGKFLYIALAIIIMGNGFFKPNISSLLGTLYQKNDPRRESGFTIFYMGINIGSMAATLIAGFVKDAFGWWAGFGLASIGLLLGVISLALRYQYLSGYGDPPASPTLPSRTAAIFHSKAAVVLAIIVGIPILSLLMHYKALANLLLLVAGVVLLIALVLIAFRQAEREQRQKMLALILLTLISILFWAVFFQIFFSVNLFIDRNVDRVVFGLQIPTIAFISFEAMFIIILAPFLAKFWTFLHYKKLNPSPGFKFFLAFLFLTLAFLLLHLSTHFHDDQGLVNPWWIPLSYLFITLGEMFLSPIGLSAVTVLAPARWVGMLMGVWFISLGYGGKLAGILAQLSSIPEGLKNPLVESQYYGRAFLIYALISLGLAVVTLVFVPAVKHLMKNAA